MTTKPDVSTTSPAQEVAITALIRGATVKDAAAEAGVSRQAVSGWKNHDPAFIALLNQRRHDVWSQVEDQLRSIHIKALDVISRELDGPSGAGVAIETMKVLARMNVTPTRPTTATEVAGEQALRSMLTF